ncbi:MAG: cation-translocating P-type ATPase [Anaerolineae bacterium]|nr:cation-translocating P-type ATPase [Anaerolineae bacterium]
MPDFYRLEVDQALAELKSDPRQGLTTEEAAQRIAQYGKNVLPAGESVSLFTLFINQFKNIMVIILIIAAVISGIVGEFEDVIVILVIVIANAALGTYQEYRAEQALQALSAMQVPNVRVRRAGHVGQVSAEDLVPGDIVLLQEGDRIPADGRLIVSANLQIEEAALTGESQATFKQIHAIADENVGIGDRKNMAFMGTSVTYGRGELLITETGLKTQLGKIATLLMNVEETQTPLQKRLDSLSVMLVRGAIVVVVLVFITGLLRGIPLQEMLVTSISLAVAAVPEGLAAIITISLSLGAGRMVKRHALIRRLPAVETLGSVTTICSDKTGTLTKNEMTATLFALPGHEDVRVSGVGYNPDGGFFAMHGEYGGGDDQPLDPTQNAPVGRFLQAMALATDAYLETNKEGKTEVVGDTTEGALVVAARKVGWTREHLEQDKPRVAELPFSSERKAMTTIHQIKVNDGLFPQTPYLAITKGAPDRLVDWAASEHMPDGVRPLTAERRAKWQAQVDEMASRGLRVLGVAYRPLDSVPAEVKPEIERELVLLGLIGILAPARPEARAAVATAREAGIRPIMITGDHALTAEAIASDLGIIQAGQKAITGAELEKMSDDQLVGALKTTSAFARVSPEHKLRLVKALQSQGEIAAMTGDGVNDAPALKQANIGIAMGITGTEVSKGAADMVLTDDNFASIVAAVEEGRTIYNNIRKFVMFLLSSNVGEILVMFVGIIIGLPVPLLAIQILWVNLVTDGLPAIALGFEPTEAGTMKRPPRPVNESIFADGVGVKIIWRAALLALLTLGAFVYGHTAHGLAPFSSTLGIENLSREQVVELVEEEIVPADWDALTVDARLALLTEVDETASEEEGGNLIIREAERIPRTIAFTVLALGQIFHVMAIHAGDRKSFFRTWFSGNRFMFYAVLSTFLLQLAVIYVPFMQGIFETFPIRLPEMLGAVAIASVILFAVEIEKLIRNSRRSAA